jgi:hypothetical protein
MCYGYIFFHISQWFNNIFIPNRYPHYKKKEDLGLKTIIIDAQPTIMINNIVKRKTSIALEVSESDESDESDESENILWEII